jgi:predicted unusual protein kinase regulating ubiquinone biosynthesis (AarF/ABC1/UbiB family)
MDIYKRSIITMEFIEGISLIDKDLLLTKGYNLKDISKTISLAFT